MESECDPPKPVITSKSEAFTNVLAQTGCCVYVQSHVCFLSLRLVHGETDLLVPTLQKRLQSRLSALQQDVSWRCVLEHARVYMHFDMLCTRS